MSALTRLLVRFVGLVAALLFASSAFAVIPKVTEGVFRYSANGTNCSYRSYYSDISIVDACTKYGSSFAAHTGLSCAEPSTPSGTSFRGTGSMVINGNCTERLDTTKMPIGTQQVCPPNSTSSGASCACNSGFKEDPTQTSCVPETNHCVAAQGSLKIINNTIGYQQSSDPSSNQVVGAVTLPPVTVCSGGCEWDTVSAPAIPDIGWVSQVSTAQGLYRVSVDTTYRQSATECTTETPTASTTATPPACPGVVGQVNGKTVCVGTSSAPVPTVVAPTPAGGKEPGNPAAGQQPATGEGSGTGGTGRTPSTGDGGPAGGPAGAAAGSTSGATGTTTKPAEGTEQQACGAPGQPVCAVTIDEKGMPDGKDAIKTDGINTEWKTKDDALNALKTQSGPSSAWGVTPFWLSTSGACHPVQLMTFPAKMSMAPLMFDICEQLPVIYTLMNLIWITITFGATIAMVLRVTTNTGG